LFEFLFYHEKDLKENPLDYDTWFDYLRLLESEEDIEQIRDAYEKAIAQVPPINVNFQNTKKVF
jgi:crooked neck